MPECPPVTDKLYRQAFLLLQGWTNKPRNYNCLPAESLIGGNNDISALLIFLASRLASAYWVTCHTHVWWGELNLYFRNDNGGHLNATNDICQSFYFFCLPRQASWTFSVRNISNLCHCLKMVCDTRRSDIPDCHSFKRRRGQCSLDDEHCVTRKWGLQESMSTPCQRFPIMWCSSCVHNS